MLVDLSADFLWLIDRCAGSDFLNVRFQIFRRQFMFAVFHPVQHRRVVALEVVTGVLEVGDVIQKILRP